jgi:hypothetical protein
VNASLVIIIDVLALTIVFVIEIVTLNQLFINSMRFSCLVLNLSCLRCFHDKFVNLSCLVSDYLRMINVR